MIKKFSDYEQIPTYDGGFKAIVPGGYICKVINVKVEDFATCSILKVAFDVVEGEFAQYYTQRFNYAKSQNANAKWNGVFDVFIPKDDGSEKDGYTKQAFKRFTTSIERSNQGYTWNWDENTLKGKLFGGIFGREQFVANDGTLKFSTKCRFANSVETIRKGDYKVPEDKLLKSNNTNYNTQWNSSQSVADELGNLQDFEEILSDNNPPF